VMLAGLAMIAVTVARELELLPIVLHTARACTRVPCHSASASMVIWAMIVLSLVHPLTTEFLARVTAVVRWM